MAVPTWILEVQAFGGPTVALAAAVGTGLIAWQQYRLAKQQHNLARQKLRLDLYPKRFRIYSIILDAVVTALNHNHESAMDQQTFLLNRSIREARFLFDPTNFEYFNRLETIVLQYRLATLAIQKGPGATQGADWHKLTTWYHQKGRWLLQQLHELPERVKDHLRIDDEVSILQQSNIGIAEPPFPDL